MPKPSCSGLAEATSLRIEATQGGCFHRIDWQLTLTRSGQAYELTVTRDEQELVATELTAVVATRYLATLAGAWAVGDDRRRHSTNWYEARLSWLGPGGGGEAQRRSSRLSLWELDELLEAMPELAPEKRAAIAADRQSHRDAAHAALGLIHQAVLDHSPSGAAAERLQPLASWTHLESESGERSTEPDIPRTT